MEIITAPRRGGKSVNLIRLWMTGPPTGVLLVPTDEHRKHIIGLYRFNAAEQRRIMVVDADRLRGQLGPAYVDDLDMVLRLWLGMDVSAVATNGTCRTCE